MTHARVLPVTPWRLVVGITDGDPITVLVAREIVKVRLVDIDAPESGQPWGFRSKQALSVTCFGKAARLEMQGKNRYRRALATVFCEGANANREQVRQGMAWVFDRYVRPDSPLYAVQREAKLDHRGLWSDPQPVPPWKWRRGVGRY
jgi:micrococcal nuclease